MLLNSIENRDPLHRRSARRKTNSISDIVIQTFFIIRSISLKKNWVQLQEKKNIKKGHMESKTVMLINSVWWRPWYFYTWRYKWYIYSVRWICICHILETEKILVFHRQPYYRYSYHISEMLRYQKKRRNCVFFFRPRALFQTSFVFERYLLVLTLTKAMIMYSTLSSSVTCSSHTPAA